MAASKPIEGIRDIITVIDLAGKRPASRVAARLAARANAHLAGFAPVVDITAAAMVGGPIAVDLFSQAAADAEVTARDAEAAFLEIARLEGLSAESGRFRVVDGAGVSLVARARVTDLVVIGQDDVDVPEAGRTAVIEALLFEAAAPVLVVPHVGDGRFALGRVVIAWDGSRPASRAVRAALPLIAAADEVRVLVVEDAAREADEPGADLVRFLTRHGYPATVDRVPSVAGDIGAALLNHAADHGTDLLVMGGYGHSRLREFVLGGPTRSVLETMTVPALMAH